MSPSIIVTLHCQSALPRFLFFLFPSLFILLTLFYSLASAPLLFYLPPLPPFIFLFDLFDYLFIFPLVLLTPLLPCSSPLVSSCLHYFSSSLPSYLLFSVFFLSYFHQIHFQIQMVTLFYSRRFLSLFITITYSDSC